MLNLSNVLSLSRIAFALAFLWEQPWVRLCAIVLAMLSDFFDGYIARRHRSTTQLGAILDPVTDKFFVFFAAGVFFVEQKLSVLGLVALLSRDIALCLFGLFLVIVGGWKGYEVKAIWWGKLMTVAQFLLLITLTLNFVVPEWIYFIFMAIGGGALVELFFRYRRS